MGFLFLSIVGSYILTIPFFDEEFSKFLFFAYLLGFVTVVLPINYLLQK